MRVLTFSIVLLLMLGLGAPVWAQPLATVEGELIVLHEDYPNGTSRYRHLIKEQKTGQHVELEFTGAQPKQWSRSKKAVITGPIVKAQGVRKGNKLTMKAADLSMTAVGPLPLTSGAQKTLLMLVKYTSTTTEPYTVAQAQSVLQQTSDFDMANSSGQMSLTWSIVPWTTATVPINMTYCDYNTIQTAGLAAARAAGINPDLYARWVFGFPSHPACGWWGLGTVGGMPSRAWINGTLALRVLGHEMGHNIGLYHSHSMYFSSGAIWADIGGQSSEYGDQWDIMGGCSGPACHFNAFQKSRLGWLTLVGGVYPAYVYVNAGGSYTVAENFMAPGLGTKALRLCLPATQCNTDFWFERRAGGGGPDGVVFLHAVDYDPNSSFRIAAKPVSGGYFPLALNIPITLTTGGASATVTLTALPASGFTLSVAYAGGGASPPAPFGDVVAAAAAKLTLTWQETDATAGIRVERRTGSAPFAAIATLPPGTTTYIDTAVVVGTTYCYRVVAFNAAGDSPYSAEACGTPAPSCASGSAPTVTGTFTVR